MKGNKILILGLLASACAETGNSRYTEEDAKKLHLEETVESVINVDDMVTMDCNDYLGSADFLFSDLLDTMFFVPLEDDEQASLIGDVRNITLTDSMIYVFDGSGVNTMVIFRKDGSFVKRLPIGPDLAR